MEIIFDKRGKPIEAVLDKDEQLKLAKENNRRAKLFSQEQTQTDIEAINSYLFEAAKHGTNIVE